MTTRKNVGFQVTTEHYALISEAAQSKAITMAEYMRRVLLDWAAADLGKSSVDLTCYSPDLVERAAKHLGLTPREFMQHAARDVAALTLGAQVPEERRAETDARRKKIITPLRPPKAA